jgi:general secretion pathway protein G
MERRRIDRGFTLIELLVVITIIGLLVGFAAVKVFDAVEEGRITRAKADIDAFENALKMYRLDNRKYPTTAEGLEKLTESTSKHQEGYLENFPYEDPWGIPYEYTSDGNTYLIVCFGRDGQEGGEGFDADIRTDDEKRPGQ